jgi:hypothetical protein
VTSVIGLESPFNVPKELDEARSIGKEATILAVFGRLKDGRQAQRRSALQNDLTIIEEKGVANRLSAAANGFLREQPLTPGTSGSRVIARSSAKPTLVRPFRQRAAPRIQF